MIIYRVEITIEPGIEAEWLDWMKRVHVPDVLRTGCFSDCRIHKVLEAAEEEPIYVMQYSCRALADYIVTATSSLPPCKRSIPIALRDAFAGRVNSWRRSHSPPPVSDRVIDPGYNCADASAASASRKSRPKTTIPSSCPAIAKIFFLRTSVSRKSRCTSRAISGVP